MNTPPILVVLCRRQHSEEGALGDVRVQTHDGILERLGPSCKTAYPLTMGLSCCGTAARNTQIIG